MSNAPLCSATEKYVIREMADGALDIIQIVSIVACTYSFLDIHT
jgi:hypothetical protein